ncbi:choline transport [Trichoderma arundinaceum]|uniref:Choline transport n=1 Tax=Trichoderma arundinaceum TaxID=490622 RepID=A0A395NG82_TRIAR|nr:choline transport [Trichoderma arundinaceum]
MARLEFVTWMPASLDVKLLEHILQEYHYKRTEMEKAARIENGESVSTHVERTGQNTESHFSLVSLAGVGLVVGNVWPALAGSLLISIFNGSAPGVIYEFIAVSLCYFAIAAVIAELASALPSSAGVHLWASVASGSKYGRLVGYFAGWWNCLAWIFAVTSVSNIAGNLCLQIHAYLHPDFDIQRWHVFVCFLAINLASCCIVCYGNSVVPYLNVIGMVVILAGAIITITVCATMTRMGTGGASNATVWTDWTTNIGYPNGFVFISGMLNGAFAMGTPDAATHLAEEIPKPEINVPKAIAAQYALGFISGLQCFTFFYISNRRGVFPGNSSFRSLDNIPPYPTSLTNDVVYHWSLCHLWPNALDTSSSECHPAQRCIMPHKPFPKHAISCDYGNMLYRMWTWDHLSW